MNESDLHSPPDPLGAAHTVPSPEAIDVRDNRTDAFPWPPRDAEPVFDAWGRTWSGAALSPRSFFAAMPAERSMGAAVLYFLSIGVPVAGAQLFWSMVRPETSAAGPALGAWSPLVEFLLSPLYLLMSLFLSAAVVHLLLLLFRGASGTYSRTVRVFAFAYSPQLLGVIPVAGGVVGSVWMVVVAIIGLREAHQTTTARSASAVLIPLAIGLVFMAVAELIMRAGAL